MWSHDLVKVERPVVVTHGTLEVTLRRYGSMHGGRGVITLLMSPCNGTKPLTSQPYA